MRLRFGYSSSNDKPAGIGEKIVATLFFGIFLAVGLFFEFLTLRMAVELIGTYTWRATPCEIVSSGAGIDDSAGTDEDRYVFNALYRYNFDGREYSSRRFRTDRKRFGSITDAEELARTYVPDSEATCYVNPKDPGRAILQRQNLAVILFVFFPLIFVVIGGVGLFATWRAGSEGLTKPQPLSESGAGKGGGKFIIGFCCLFVLIGVALLYFFFIRPVMRMVDARNWQEVECRIISSRVQSHESDDGTTYSVDVLYEYEYSGQIYRSNRYHFFSGSSSGYASKRKAVQRYPRGSTRTCFVDPDRPMQSVLDREISGELWFGLIPLAFVLFGGVGVIAGWRQLRKERGDHRLSQMGSGPTERGPDRPIVLKPAASPFAKLFGIILMALFWNGIVSIFVWQAIKGFQRGRPDWFLTIFMVPFVLVGLLLIFGIFYQFLSMFNPRIELTLNRGLQLGSTAEVSWLARGRVSALQNLKFTLEGKEEVHYRRGTSNYVDKETFATIPIRELTSTIDMRAGSASLEIPAIQMHSFDAPNNKVLWIIRAKGGIAFWPDVNEEFSVNVAPLSPEKVVKLSAMNV